MVCEHCNQPDCPGDEYDFITQDGYVSMICCDIHLNEKGGTMRIMVCEHCKRADCPGDEYDVLWPDGNVSQTCCSDKNINVENRTLKVFISNTDPMYVPIRPSPGWGSDGKRD